MPAPIILAVLVAYGVLLLGIGLWGGRDAKDLAGYFVAGKKLPSWVIAFSTNATGESAWLLLGLTGMGYAIGIHALWIVLGEVLGVAVAWAVVALPFKEYTDRYDAITVPDYLAERFRDTRHIFRILSLVIIVSMVTAYTAAQLTAIGKAFNAFVATSYEIGVVIGAVIILYYTSVGGFKAVAYSDLVQGVLMFLGLLVLPIVGFVAAGGWTSVMTTLHAEDPALLAPMGEYGMSLAGIVSVVGFVAIGFAFLGAPQLLTRFMSAKNGREIVNASLIGVICIIVFDVGAVFAGMAGRSLFPGLTDPETILPMMSTELFPPVFTGIFLVIVLAASMSTVDSLLILSSSVVVRDVIQQIFNPAISERRLSLFGKLTTVVIGGVALGFALGEVRMIFTFVLFAWSGLASAFTPVVLCSLFWRRTTRAGAVAGMIAGFLTAIIWVVAFKEQMYDLYEMIPGFVAGFAVTIGVSLVTEPPDGAAEELDSVHRAVRTNLGGSSG
ncbi:MAG: sodium/proline symporter [Gemmatimonadetes bacterium]|nr:sodium/proline symporter [Gemmatimonadota bacterium]